MLDVERSLREEFQQLARVVSPSDHFETDVLSRTRRPTAAWKQLPALAAAVVLVLVVVVVFQVVRTKDSEVGNDGSFGTLTGSLLREGGLPGATTTPLAGTVTVTGEAFTKDIAVGENGQYTIDLPPGDYTVVGHSPDVIVGGVQADCPGRGVASIHTGSTTALDAVCAIR